MDNLFQKIERELAQRYSREETVLMARIMLEKLSGLSRTQILAKRDIQLNEEQNHRLSEWVEQLKAGEPFQYVLGETEFFGLPFIVSPAVLIPRPETEELVEWVLEDLAVEENKDGFSIVDIGTGSGCIPIALKKNAPYAIVSGTDISAEALIVARENAKLNGVEVDFIQDSIMNPARQYDKFDYIVSNPPYIPISGKPETDEHVRLHEPSIALFVDDEDPFIFFRYVALFAQKHLKPTGKLYFETHYQFAREVASILEDMGFKSVLVRKDISGNERMVRAEV